MTSFGNLNEVSAGLAEANAYLQVAVRPDALSSAAAGSIDSCIARLVASLPMVSSWGLTDSNTSQLVTQTMTSLVNETRSIFSDLFIPSSSTSDPESVDSSVEDYLQAVTSSLSNPIAAVIATQQNVLLQGLQQVRRIVFNESDGSGMYNQYADRLEKLFKTLFLNDPETGFSGLFSYAFEEGIPAIDSELVYLSKLKRLAKTGIEDAANLPDIIEPGLPNASAAMKLCEAEKWLRIVEDKLKRDNIFDRKAFGAATANVCKTKDQVYDGAIDADFLNYHAGNVVGLSDAEMRSLASGRFLPNVQFRLNLIQINFYIQAFEGSDVNTRSLHNNFLSALDYIERLAETRIGDLMALIVGLLRRQISGVRADLESQAQGFSGYNDAQTEATERKRAETEKKAQLAATPSNKTAQLTPSAEVNKAVPYTDGFGRTVRGGQPGAAFGSQQVDVYAYTAAQASAYIILSALCALMSKTTAVYSVLDRVLSGESAVIAFIRNFIGTLNTECPSSQGGAEVVSATAAYVRAMEDRLNGVTKTNDRVLSSARTMIRRIDEYEKFLRCFKQQMFFGNSSLSSIVTTAANAAALYRNTQAMVDQIKAAMKMYPQVKQMFATMDLGRMTGLDGAQYNALDTVIGSLQCLILQCDNPYVTNLASTAAAQFREEFGKRRAEAITIGSLDEVPKTGMVAIILKKVQAVQRLLDLIKRLTNFNVNDLCSVKTVTSPSTTPDPTPNVVIVSTRPANQRAVTSLGTLPAATL